jgi:hypothetical protein
MLTTTYELFLPHTPTSLSLYWLGVVFSTLSLLENATVPTPGKCFRRDKLKKLTNDKNLVAHNIVFSKKLLLLSFTKVTAAKWFEKIK